VPVAGGDANLVALYTFEDDWPTNEILNDSAPLTGTNNLTTEGSGGPAYPDRVTDPMEGTYSADLTGGVQEYFALADASLSTYFPGRSSTGSVDFSITAWIKPESLSNMMTIASKYDSGAGERSWRFQLDTDGGLGLVIGYNSGGSFIAIDHEGVIVAGQSYHVAVVYDDNGGGDSKGTVQLWVWDVNAVDASCTASEAPWVCCSDSGVGSCDEAGDKWLMSGASKYEGDDFGQQMSIDTGPFGLGAMFNNTNRENTFDGIMDEVAIFKDNLTESEINQIRLGTYTF